MRVLLSSDHEYPASNGHGSGLHPKAFPSGSGYTLQDLLAKGLAELGHEVFYLVRRLRENFSAQSVPDRIKLIFEPDFDADVLHTISGRDASLITEWERRGKPWVATCHMDEQTRERERGNSTGNWIFVSQTLARLHGRDRYVWNGIDPGEYIYSETKDDYFLFMSTMDWGTKKGLDIVLSMAKQLGFKLVVAGTGESYERIAHVQEMCRKVGARYVGDVRGKEKAELLAGAKGFLFPTKLDEAFGLGMVEALMSGTPVICSDRGACPEIITPEVGFVCHTDDDYLTAIDKISGIDPRACREKAMRDYHYHTMARNYVREYEIERARTTRERARPANTAFMNQIIQGLWVGNELSVMEQLSIASFLRHGHEYHLYVYEDVKNIPAGTTIKDGNEILSASRIFQYKQHASYAGFSNFFRYKLVLERGGWWVDTDTICLRYFDFAVEYVFSSEFAMGQEFINSGIFKAPAGSEVMEYAWRVCETKDPEHLAWGETGPRLMAAAVQEFSLESYRQRPEVFCPIGYADWHKVLEPDAELKFDGSYAIHLWNERWRGAGQDKNGTYPPGCLYERWKEEYL